MTETDNQDTEGERSMAGTIPIVIYEPIKPQGKDLNHLLSGEPGVVQRFLHAEWKKQ